MKKLIEEAVAALPAMHGWCSAEKATKFIEIISEYKPEICIEIGVFGGSSLIPQAMALKENNKGIIYGIDPWTNDSALEEMISEEHREWWGKLNLEDIYKHCLENISKYHVNGFCNIIKNKSENVVNLFKDDSVDILHIDGNHSETLSYKDVTLYFPKVKIGGFIFFDDIWWTEIDNKVTTRKAISYLFENCEKFDLVNNDCLILKKISN